MKNIREKQKETEIKKEKVDEELKKLMEKLGGEHPVTKEPMHIRRKTRIKDRERVGHEKVQRIDELRNRCMFKAILATKTVNVLAMKTFKEFVN